MPDVFISYARSDSADFVRRLTDALQAAGIDVWVDLDDIPAASDWQQDLRDGVLQSDCFCFVVSPKSAASPYCLGELSDAEGRNKRVIPLIHLPVAEADLPRLLQRLNWVPPRGAFGDDFDANLAILAEAIRTDLEATRAHTRWERAAEAWNAKGRDASLLPRGSELREAETWIAAQTGRDPAPTANQAEFVEAARRANERRRRMVFGATVAALAIAVTLGIVALAQRNEARVQRDNARSNELASAAQANLDTDPELSMILAREAVETVDTPRAEQALAQAISRSLVRMTLDDPAGKPVQAAVYSPDGRLIATAGDGGVALWDAESGKRLRSVATDRSFDVAFTPDSKQIGVAGVDGALRVFDVADGSLRTSIETAAGDLYSVDISRDGKLIAAAGANQFAASYPISGGTGVVFKGHDPGPGLSVNSIAYSPNSQVLLTASADGTARLWFAADARQIALLRPPDRPAVPGIQASRPGAPTSDAEFNPDGNSIATANVDGTISLWPLDSPGRVRPAQLTAEGDGFVINVDFDPRRDALLAAGIGGASAYDLDTGELIASYRGQEGFVYQAQPSPDGSRLVTAAQDGTARVWAFSAAGFSEDLPVLVTDVDFARDGDRLASSGFPVVTDVTTHEPHAIPFERGVAVAQLAWDPAADRIALAGTDGIVRIVDPVSGKPAGPVLDPPGHQITRVAWSGDGSRLVALTLADGLVVYDAETGDKLLALEGVFIAAALSPDGDDLAYYGSPTRDDRTVRIVDVDSGDTVRSLAGHTSSISAIAYSGDGSKLVTGSDDASARIWDPATGEQLIPRLNNQGQGVGHAAISADGRFAATVGGGLAVWNTETGRELMRVPGFEGDLDFSPDGKLIAAIGPGDKTVSLVDCDVCVDDVDSLLALADERITREPTAAERNEYLER